MNVYRKKVYKSIHNKVYKTEGIMSERVFISAPKEARNALKSIAAIHGAPIYRMLDALLLAWNELPKAKQDNFIENAIIRKGTK